LISLTSSAIVAAGVHLLDAGKRRRPREAPRVDVEHERDRHIDVVAMESTLSGREAKLVEFGHHMKDQLAVAVVDAFRQPRGSRCIKSGCLDVLVEVREAKVCSCDRKQLLIFTGEFEFAGYGRVVVGENDKPFGNCGKIDCTRSTNSSLTSSVDEPAWSIV
jgi:hypothetical protein